jgi:adenylate cyclase
MAIAMLPSHGDDPVRGFGAPPARIGIDTGPVVAGVIGSRFIYDAGGARSTPRAGWSTIGFRNRIQVPSRVVDALRDSHEFEPRGPIEVKGKGPMEAWLLVG